MTGVLLLLWWLLETTLLEALGVEGEAKGYGVSMRSRASTRCERKGRWLVHLRGQTQAAGPSWRGAVNRGVWRRLHRRRP